MAKALASFIAVLSVLLIPALSTASAENLPVAVDRYAQACTKTGGSETHYLDGGNSGVIYCTWLPRDRTECKVGSNQVNQCMIRCSSNACVAANPNKHLPVWPLSGGPKKMAPVDTLAPQQLAPVN